MPTIRVNSNDKFKLDQICQETELSHPDVFHLAITLLEKERRAKQIQADFEALALNNNALKTYRKESKNFDNASSDGLKE
jgi:isopentenyl diphosphate isomerase/L-lactate dehydrogenase-like FMN-dependent dehydrogenase